MNSNRLAILGLAALAIVALVGALALTGGPWYAAKERRDEGRSRDLGEIEQYVQCIARGTNALPETVTERKTCGALPRLADPVTGAPYRYKRMDSDTFMLCADFETEEMTSRSRGRQDYEDGCAIHMRAKS